MSSYIEFAKLHHMVSIKKHVCPDCGNIIERAASPGGKTTDGERIRPFEYWDFYCINEECKKVWRVPRALYEAAFGEWGE